MTGMRSADSRVPPTSLTRALDQQLHQADRTRGLLVTDIDNRERVVRARIRSAYRALYRSSWAPAWSGPRDSRPGEPGQTERDSAVQARQRAGIRRILVRDLREIELVRAELAHVEQARERLTDALQQARSIPQLAPGSLRNPVAYSKIVEPFGTYRHSASKARLSRRGATLSSQIGRNVRAAADGRVRYLGQVRGLGLSVLLDHGDYFTLYGPLTRIATQVDAAIKRADIIGESATERVYFEVRMSDGAAGVPVDPAPLIAR